jgi:16S rRNA (guanine527-N7)-methyltransferase
MESEGASSTGAALSTLLQRAGLAPLEQQQIDQFENYLSLFIRWNARTNLSSVREPQAILERHLVESVACAQALPQGIGCVLDFGSGGGLPGIPISICRPEISVTLAESQGKKAAFLQEAVRVLGISAHVYAGRAETLTQHFDCVVMRAVDKMAEAVKQGAALVEESGYLALMSTQSDLPKLVDAAGTGFSWNRKTLLPGGIDRILALGERETNSPA